MHGFVLGSTISIYIGKGKNNEVGLEASILASVSIFNMTVGSPGIYITQHRLLLLAILSGCSPYKQRAKHVLYVAHDSHTLI